MPTRLKWRCCQTGRLWHDSNQWLPAIGAASIFRATLENACRTGRVRRRVWLDRSRVFPLGVEVQLNNLFFYGKILKPILKSRAFGVAVSENSPRAGWALTEVASGLTRPHREFESRGPAQKLRRFDWWLLNYKFRLLGTDVERCKGNWALGRCNFFLKKRHCKPHPLLQWDMLTSNVE